MAFLRRRWLSGLHPKTASNNSRSTKISRTSQRHRNCLFETLETRALLSATNLSDIFAQPAVSGGYSVAQITSAYLASNLSFVTSLKGSITGNGSGQTIAIVDAYNDPNIVSDVNTFSTKFGLPLVTNANLKVVSQTGSSSLPASSPTGPWRSPWMWSGPRHCAGGEYRAGRGQILQPQRPADRRAVCQHQNRRTSVVSMSWGTNEFRGETSYDSYFTTPGVTFVASSGDSGVTSWPSVSSNVLAVGGTTLTLTSSNAYGSEKAWSDSGGGVDWYKALPSYQKMIGISASGRVTPDVSYDANPSTGFLVYDSVATGGSSGWMVVGGTSAGAPQWAGIIAIANEGRVANGLSTLTQANAMIYTIYDTSGKSAQDFHDVSSGRNTSGFSAMKGYDAVTGLGSPVVSSLVSDLATATATSGPTSTTKITIGTTPGSGGLGGWGGWGGRGVAGADRGGGWSGWWSPFGMTASSTQPSAPAALPWHPASDSSPALHAEVAAASQVVVAPITNVSTADLSSSPQPARSTTWEGSFGDGAPSIEYASGADEATVAIFGPRVHRSAVSTAYSCRAGQSCNRHGFHAIVAERN